MTTIFDFTKYVAFHVFTNELSIQWQVVNLSYRNRMTDVYIDREFLAINPEYSSSVVYNLCHIGKVDDKIEVIHTDNVVIVGILAGNNVAVIDFPGKNKQWEIFTGDIRTENVQFLTSVKIDGKGLPDKVRRLWKR